MEEQFWHDRWENNQIGFHQESINLSLESYWSDLGLPAGQTVFVPLCGKSRDMLWLRDQGYKVIGNEVSSVAVEAFFTENNLVFTRTEESRFVRYVSEGITLLCGDFFQLSADDLPDVYAVYDRASLIALPPQMRVDYVKQFGSLFPEVLQCLLITLEYDQAGMSGPPFSVQEEEVSTLYAECFSIDCLEDFDALVANPQFRKRGLDVLVEKIYRIAR